MSDGGGPEYRVHVGGGVTGQVVVGDHNVVINAHGSTVTVRDGAPPSVRRRTRPVGQVVPRPSGVLVGRDKELSRLASWLDEGVPVQIYGPRGIGKSALLRRLAADRSAAGAAVVFVSAAGLAVEDVVQELFQACYDAEGYRPKPARLRRLMGSIRALFVIDDFAGDTTDLQTLLDASPSSDLVVAGTERSMWSEGRSLELRGLTEGPAFTLIEHELGRSLDDADAEVARRLWQAAHGHPRALLQAAAAAGTAAGPSLAADPRMLTRALVASLSTAARDALDVLRAFDGLPARPRLITVLTGLDDSGAALNELQRARLAEPVGAGVALARSPAVAAAEPDRPPRDAGEFAGRLAVWLRTGVMPHDVADAAPVVVRVLAAAVGRGDHAAALDLARAAAPALGRSLRWGSWAEVLAFGLRAAQHLGAADDEAYFAHEDQVRRRALGLAVGLAAGATIGGLGAVSHAALPHAAAKPGIAAVATHPAAIAVAVAAVVATGIIGVSLATAGDEQPVSATGLPADPQIPQLSPPTTSAPSTASSPVVPPFRTSPKPTTPSPTTRSPTSPAPPHTESTLVQVDSTSSWQDTGITLQDGESFSIAYNDGRWTVFDGTYPYVDPRGYDVDYEDSAQMGSTCKVESSFPYGFLLGRVGDGGTIPVGAGDTLRASSSGRLDLRINDQDSCLYDNAGSVSVVVKTQSRP